NISQIADLESKIRSTFENSQHILTRKIRGEPGPPKEICCGKVKFNQDILKWEMENCEEPPDSPDRTPSITCIYECAGKSQDLLDENGYMKVEELAEFSTFTVTGDEKLEQHVRKCSKKIIPGLNESVRKMKEDMDMDCNIAFETFMELLFSYVMISCPREIRSESPVCIKYRQELKEYVLSEAEKIKRGEYD
ncbi:hypothetical protein C0J52_17908, partial [Blattella germanica]